MKLKLHRLKPVVSNDLVGGVGSRKVEIPPAEAGGVDELLPTYRLIKSLNSFCRRLTATAFLCDKLCTVFFDIHRRGDLRQLAPRKKLLKSREGHQQFFEPRAL